jgi:hypothetical protein
VTAGIGTLSEFMAVRTMGKNMRPLKRLFLLVYFYYFGK